MNETGGNGWNSHAPKWTSLSTSGKQFYSLLRVSSTYLALIVLSTFGESQKKKLTQKMLYQQSNMDEVTQWFEAVWATQVWRTCNCWRDYER
jgi:hypothetical protein